LSHSAASGDWAAVLSAIVQLRTLAEQHVVLTAGPTRAGLVPRSYVRHVASALSVVDAAHQDAAVKAKLTKPQAKSLLACKQRLQKETRPSEGDEWSTALAADLAALAADPSAFDVEPDLGDLEAEAAEREKPTRDSIFSMKPEDITFALVNAKLEEATLSLGKRGMHKQEQLNLLLFLRKHAKTRAQEAAVVTQLVALMLALTPASALFLPASVWRRAVLYVCQLLDLAESVDPAESSRPSTTPVPPGPAPRLTPTPTGAQAASGVAGSGSFRELCAAAGHGGDRADGLGAGCDEVPCNLVGLVERLDEELHKCLQVTDPHTAEYMSRLRDEAVLLALTQRVSMYLESRKDNAGVARIALRQLEHLYFKTDAVFAALRRACAEPMPVTMRDIETRMSFALERDDGTAADADADAVDEDEREDERLADGNALGGPSGPGARPDLSGGATVLLRLAFDAGDAADGSGLAPLVRRLAQICFQHGDERAKARALLCLVFHLSLRNEFYVARDTLLTSHLADSVSVMDLGTQILYNRAIAALGLAAFRCGLLPESYQCLGELYGSGHAKELLAQGLILSKTADKTPEQEAAERRRQVPFHAHVNLELVETVHLSCCLVLDLPSLVRGGRGAMQSAPFRRLMDNQAKASFIGPPETVRDHVMAAARQVLLGDWRGGFSHVAALRAWDLLPDREAAMAMLRRELQRIALKARRDGGRRCWALLPPSLSLSLSLSCSLFPPPPPAGDDTTLLRTDAPPKRGLT